jgi:rhodanese-related sulfurtransferase
MAELRSVNVDEALELVVGGALVLDVREDNEWAAGRAPDSLHISLNEVPDRLDTLAKDRMVVCVCRSGARSSRAGKFLIEQGFDAVNLEGGIIAWAAEGQVLVADVGEPTII